jgi:hypothetical protein
MKYIHRLDITLTEEVVSEQGLMDLEPVLQYVFWIAEVDTFLTEQVGHTHRSAERIKISRTGRSPEEALKTLEQALASHGWEIR